MQRVRRPGRHRPRPLRHLRRRPTAATPSRSSGTTAASGSGSPSPSTASSPTSPNSATSCSTQADYHLTRDTDTEIIMHSLSHELPGRRHRRRLVRRLPPPRRAVRRRLQHRPPRRPSATWSSLRDPLGFRPLCFAQDGPLFAAASESVPLLEPRLPRHPLARAGRDDPDPGRRDPHRSASPTAQTPVALLLRVDLLRQRRQHARRPQRLPDPRRAGQGAGPAGAAAGPRAARRRHDRRAGARHRQGRRRRDGLRAGRAVGRGADPQPLRRPDVHRGPEPGRARAAEVHAAARGAGRQARAAGRGHHRPQHDDEGAAARPPRARRRDGDPRPRRLPADHRAVLLRHRHVHGAASCSPRGS